MPSGLENWEDEWKEDDLDDLDPERSGGELGAVGKVVISSLKIVVGDVNERCKGLAEAVMPVSMGKQGLDLLKAEGSATSISAVNER